LVTWAQTTRSKRVRVPRKVRQHLLRRKQQAAAAQPSQPLQPHLQRQISLTRKKSKLIPRFAKNAKRGSCQISNTRRTLIAATPELNAQYSLCITACTTINQEPEARRQVSPGWSEAEPWGATEKKVSPVGAILDFCHPLMFFGRPTLRKETQNRWPSCDKSLTFKPPSVTPFRS